MFYGRTLRDWSCGQAAILVLRSGLSKNKWVLPTHMPGSGSFVSLASCLGLTTPYFAKRPVGSQSLEEQVHTARL